MVLRCLRRGPLIGLGISIWCLEVEGPFVKLNITIPQNPQEPNDEELDGRPKPRNQNSTCKIYSVAMWHVWILLFVHINTYFEVYTKYVVNSKVPGARVATYVLLRRRSSTSSLVSCSVVSSWSHMLLVNLPKVAFYALGLATRKGYRYIISASINQPVESMPRGITCRPNDPPEGTSLPEHNIQAGRTKHSILQQ